MSLLIIRLLTAIFISSGRTCLIRHSSCCMHSRRSTAFSFVVTFVPASTNILLIFCQICWFNVVSLSDCSTSAIKGEPGWTTIFYQLQTTLNHGQPVDHFQLWRLFFRFCFWYNSKRTKGCSTSQLFQRYSLVKVNKVSIYWQIWAICGHSVDFANRWPMSICYSLIIVIIIIIIVSVLIFKRWRIRLGEYESLLGAYCSSLPELITWRRHQERNRKHHARGNSGYGSCYVESQLVRLAHVIQETWKEKIYL